MQLAHVGLPVGRHCDDWMVCLWGTIAMQIAARPKARITSARITRTAGVERLCYSALGLHIVSSPVQKVCKAKQGITKVVCTDKVYFVKGLICMESVS